MNPFTFNGPAFLLFYFVFTLLTCFAMHLVRRQREMDGAALDALLREPVNDPYRIAYLRGGKNEVLRVAIVSLIDRGYLVVERQQVRATGLSPAELQRPFERRIVELFAKPQKAQDAFQLTFLDVAAYETALTRQRLLPDDEIRAMRASLFFAGGTLLFATGAIKVAIGLSGDRPVLILIGMMLVAVAVAYKVVHPRMTELGRRFLAEVHNLFESLKLRASRLRARSGSAEVALLAGVFGVAALPSEAFRWSRDVFPRAQQSTASACGGSCGSSCGGNGCGGGSGCGGCGG